MLIVHLSGGRISDGAVRGAYWLHKGLLKLGLNSHFVIPDAVNKGRNVYILDRTYKNRKLAKLTSTLNFAPLMLYKRQNRHNFSTNLFGRNIFDISLLKKADIIHLHWINNVVGINFFKKIDKPVVWTIRDMWPITGGCHYSLGCERFENYCGMCPELNSRNSLDLSYVLYHLKRKYFSKSLIFPVCISEWLAGLVKKSTIFKHSNIEIIPNAVDTEIFFEIERKIARQVLGLPFNKKIILTAANYLAPWKGFKFFLKSLKFLKNKEFYFIFFGRIDNGIQRFLVNKNIPFKVYGYLFDDISIRLLYSAADIFVMPSIQEAFGKMIIEAMACGTPVVCFDATGPAEIVTHKKDGYKARAYEVSDMAMGIEWIANLNEKDFKDLCQNAVEKVQANFTNVKIAQKYKLLYEKILNSI